MSRAYGGLAVPGVADEGTAATAADEVGRGHIEGLWSLLKNGIHLHLMAPRTN